MWIDGSPVVWSPVVGTCISLVVLTAQEHPLVEPEGLGGSKIS